MMENANIYYRAQSDDAIIERIGKFIKHHRLEQNKTQQQLAKEAGINRSTLIDIEQGRSVTALTLIQILRALDKLDVFNQFEVEQKLSPIQLAKLQVKERQRASRSSKDDKNILSDW